jgi:hypothetical protein
VPVEEEEEEEEEEDMDLTEAIKVCQYPQNIHR